METTATAGEVAEWGGHGRATHGYVYVAGTGMHGRHGRSPPRGGRVGRRGTASERLCGMRRRVRVAPLLEYLNSAILQDRCSADRQYI